MPLVGQVGALGGLRKSNMNIKAPHMNKVKGNPDVCKKLIRNG